MKTRAAILVQSKADLVVDDIEVPPLGEGQVLVKVLYTTICGAQINEIDAVKGVDKYLPHLLGHEASGIVEEIGPGVSHIKPGDSVVLHWRPGAGMEAVPARYCRADDSGQLSVWEPINAGRVTTFQEHTVVSENRVTPIPSDFEMKIAPLLGCAITTAMGVVNNDASVHIGDSVVVIGVGGVGLPIVQFAEVAGAYPIIAVDNNIDKIKRALRNGAHQWAMAPHEDEQIKQIVGPNGADVVIETSGKEVNSRMGFELTREGGTFVGVGVPEPSLSEYEGAYDPVHRNRYPDLLGKSRMWNGRRITQSHGGDSHPEADIPRIIKLYQALRISFDGQITHEFSLDQINEAFAVMRSGAGGRIAIKMER